VTHGDGKTYTAEVSAFKRMSSSMHCVQGESCDASMAGSELLSWQYLIAKTEIVS